MVTLYRYLGHFI